VAPHHPHHHRRRLATIAGIAVIGASAALAGCGDDTTPPGATATSPSATVNSSDAASAVAAAFARLRAGTYESTTRGTSSFDASGLDASLRGAAEAQFATQPTDVDTATRFESPERIAITQRLPAGQQEIVLYDGDVFVRRAGGDWARVTGEAASAFAQATSLAGLDPTALYSAIRNDGPTEADGRPATRYVGTIDPGRAGDLLAGVLAGLGGAGSAIRDAVALDGGTATILVDDATGTVARNEVALEVSFDFGALAQAAGADAGGDLGSVRMSGTSTETVGDVGGDVVVTRPEATTTVSTISGLGEFLAG
jgi:hypothetical protein